MSLSAESAVANANITAPLGVLLQKYGVRNAEIKRLSNVSEASISLYVRGLRRPKHGRYVADMDSAIRKLLLSRSASTSEIDEAFARSTQGSHTNAHPNPMELPTMNDAVLEFLGLESNPFHPATVSRSEDVLRTDQHVRLVKRIVSACIEARLSLIIGEHGSGKTTAADSAQLALANQEVDMLRFPVVGVYNAATITKNIIKTLFEFYEINESIKRPFGQQKKIEKIITAIRDSKRRLAILIDDGHAMNSATFLAIKRIYDFFKFGHEHLVGFVILTQPSVKSKLVQLDMEEFTGHCERIEVAGLLSAEEIDAYISRKFRKVVADSAITVSVENWFQLTKLESGLCHPDHNVASTIFACYARPVSGLREKSAQVSPRRLGEICVKALERAATKGRRVVTPEIINHIHQFPVWPVD